jgi:UDP-N-acetylmuramate--alanine ligase
LRRAVTAVEAQIPDLKVAFELGLPILHRSELLAELLQAKDSVAIAGVSGKSTVSAMVFEILSAAERHPSLVTGGDLLSLRQRGVRGNAWVGTGPLVAEADESDGTLVRYHPSVGVVLNLHLDHMGYEGLMSQFTTFRDRCRDHFCVSDQPELLSLSAGATVFGFSDRAEVRGSRWRATSVGSEFEVGDVTVRVPMPGFYNASNALAALTVTQCLGVSLEVGAAALESYGGVSRRFEHIGTWNGVRVYDDFAHNPEKIISALTAAKSLGQRVLAVFRPHGFGPSRQMRPHLVERIPRVLGTEDRCDYLPIYFAGGTVQRTIESSDLAQDLIMKGVKSLAVETDHLPEHLANLARPGDVILLMGARDPGLSSLARAVFDRLRR